MAFCCCCCCGAAMGIFLVERLRNAGQTFKILEGGASTA